MAKSLSNEGKKELNQFSLSNKSCDPGSVVNKYSLSTKSSKGGDVINEYSLSKKK